MPLTASAIAARRVSAEGQEGLKAFLEKRKAVRGPHDQAPADREPRRDRAAHHPRVPRAGHRERRGVLRRRRRCAARQRRGRAVAIGPAPAQRQLSVDPDASSMPSARPGADAVHPGYGFLSENAAFAAPAKRPASSSSARPRASSRRWDRRSRRARWLQSAGVPVVPGETPDDQTDDGLRQAVERVGLPVLIKASAGGGGKGMRTSAIPARSARPLQAARREASAAFGDGTLYVERLIERPRHVEVQVFADAHGRIDSPVRARVLGPAPASEGHRGEPVAGADAAAARAHDRRGRSRPRAAPDYRNAGTIEFLLDGAGDDARFYFLEMNTRLQVEHPRHRSGRRRRPRARAAARRVRRAAAVGPTAR